jgi:hypothetical protein
MSARAKDFGGSEELMTLILKAIDDGITLAERLDGSFIPFLLTGDAMWTLAMGTPTNPLEGASTLIQKLLSLGTEHCVLVYAGYVTVEEKRTDAIFAEGFVHGKEKSLRFAQSYKPAAKHGLLRKGRPLQRVGEVRFLGEGVQR